MHPFRIALALIAGGLAAPMLASPLELYLRHQTPDAPFLAYGLAPVAVAILALGAAALFAQDRDTGRVIRTSLHVDGRKVGSAVTRQTDAAADERP